MDNNARECEERLLRRNDPCHCGSGKKYKRCHQKADRFAGKAYVYRSSPIDPLLDSSSLRENTLAFIECLRGDLGIRYDENSGHGYITKDVSDGAIKRTYGRLPYFFPHSAPYRQICNSIASDHLSGFYWGSPNVNRVATHLTRYSLYTSHIIVTNPFCDMMRYHLDASPLDRPGIWKQQVINKAMFLVSLEPWIREGIITLLPPIKWTDHEFFKEKLVPVAENRFAAYSEDQQSALEFEGFLEIARCFHPDDMSSFVDNFMQGAPKSLVDGIVSIVHDEFRTNPARYLFSGPGNEQMIAMGTSHNLESAVFTAELCGSYMLFGEKQYQREYRFASQRNPSDDCVVPTDALTQLSFAFAELEFSFLNCVDLGFALSLRKEGKLSGLRTFLNDLWRKVSSVEGIERLNADRYFREEIVDQYNTYKEEWKDISKNLGRQAVASAGGAALAVLSGKLEISVAMGGLAGFQLKQLLDSYSSRQQHQRLPLGIFLQLDRQVGGKKRRGRA